MMSIDMSAIPLCTIASAPAIIYGVQVLLLLILWSHLMGVLVAWRCCCGVPGAMREPKRETVEPLENMN